MGLEPTALCIVVLSVLPLYQRDALYQAAIEAPFLCVMNSKNKRYTKWYFPLSIVVFMGEGM